MGDRGALRCCLSDRLNANSLHMQTSKLQLTCPLSAHMHCIHNLAAFPAARALTRSQQDKCEPPIYVSDRRFMKAVQMLQVAAHADGRAAVNEYDCLLLEYVFGNRCVRVWNSCCDVVVLGICW